MCSVRRGRTEGLKSFPRRQVSPSPRSSLFNPPTYDGREGPFVVFPRYPACHCRNGATRGAVSPTRTEYNLDEQLLIWAEPDPLEVASVLAARPPRPHRSAGTSKVPGAPRRPAQISAGRRSSVSRLNRGGRKTCAVGCCSVTCRSLPGGPGLQHFLEGRGPRDHRDPHLCERRRNGNRRHSERTGFCAGTPRSDR